MTTIFVPYQLWIAADQAGCDGPGSCRDFTIAIQGRQVVAVTMVEPLWLDAIDVPLRIFQGMVGMGAWPRVLDGLLALAEKQAELPPDWRNAG